MGLRGVSAAPRTDWWGKRAAGVFGVCLLARLPVEWDASGGFGSVILAVLLAREHGRAAGSFCR